MKLEKITVFPEIKKKFKDITLSVNSTRIDLILSKLLKISRKDTLEYMKKKRILLNYSEISKIVNIKEEDVLSVEGYGKIIIVSLENNKNNIRLNLKKYC